MTNRSRNVVLLVALLVANIAVGAVSGVVVPRYLYHPFSTSALDRLQTCMALLPVLPGLLVIVQGVELRVRRPWLLFPLLGVIACLAYFVTLEAPRWWVYGRLAWDVGGRNLLVLSVAIGLIAGFAAAGLATRLGRRAGELHRGFPVAPVDDAADGSDNS